MMQGLDPDKVGRIERLTKDLQTLAMHYTGQSRPARATLARRSRSRELTLDWRG